MRVLFLLVLFTQTSFTLTSSEVYKKVEPSIVYIESKEGLGSGIITSIKGEIITNFHVVNTPSKLNIRAKVFENGKFIEKTFEDVKIKSVHKEYDLAVLEINNLSNKLKPISIFKNPIETGAIAYAIGNPGTSLENQSLRNTITSGIISASQRKINSLNYIQTSVPINPGNSGGALVNDKGELVGVVTFKMLEVENIGFAIPIHLIKSTDFVEIKKRVGNIEIANSYFDNGMKLFKQARQELKNSKIEQINFYNQALQFFKRSLDENPNKADTNFLVARLYSLLEANEISIKYFKKAYQIENNNPKYCYHFATALEKSKQSKEALAVFQHGFFLKKDGSAECASSLAQIKYKQKNWLEALYTAQYAFIKKIDIDTNRKIINETSKHLNTDIFNKITIKSKAQEFSLLELQSLLQNKTVPQNIKIVEHTTKDFNLYIDKIKNLQSMKSISNEFNVKKTPSEIVEFIPCMGGAYIAIKFNKLKKLAIFSNIDNKFIKYISVPTNDYVMASGGKNLAISLKGEHSIQIYDLLTFKKISEIITPHKSILDKMHMARDNSTFIFCSFYSNSNALNNREHFLIDIEKSKFTKISNKDNTFNDKSNKYQIHSSADLSQVLLWSQNNISRISINLKNLHNETIRNQIKKYYNKASYISLSETGGTIFTHDRKIISDSEKLYKKSRLMEVGNGHFLEIQSNNDVILRRKYDDKIINKFSLPIRLNQDIKYDSPFAINNQISTSLVSNTISVIDPKKKNIYSRKLFPKGVNFGYSKKIASPGSLWYFQLNLKSDDKVVLEDVPAGMRLKGNYLYWLVPEGFTAKNLDLILNIITANGEENYRIIDLVVSHQP